MSGDVTFDIGENSLVMEIIYQQSPNNVPIYDIFYVKYSS